MGPHNGRPAPPPRVTSQENGAREKKLRPHVERLLERAIHDKDEDRLRVAKRFLR